MKSHSKPENNYDIKSIIQEIKSSKAKYLVVKFTIPSGELCQTALWTDSLLEQDFLRGIPVSGVFDGLYSLVKSDALLVPDVSSISNNSLQSKTSDEAIIALGSICNPRDMKPLPSDPRNILKKAIDSIIESGIGDKVLIGPEIEFSIFDDVTFNSDTHSCFHTICEPEQSKKRSKFEYPRQSQHPMGRTPMHYLPSHKDTLFEIRSVILERLADLGFSPRSHLHEDSPGQCEIVVKHDDILRMADYTQLAKQVCHNVSSDFDKVATFMPYPITNRPGNGHHVNISIWKNGKNIFYDRDSNSLSEKAKHFIGGIIKNARALNCICNPTVNSYRRLAAHFNIHAPVNWGEKNRTSAIRIPSISGKQSTRLEIRFPDNCANPYYSYSALLMAGLDGIKNGIVANDAESRLKPPFWHSSGFARDLYEAAKNLNENHGFLTTTDVFNESLVNFLCHRAILLHQEHVYSTSPLDFEHCFSI